MAKDEIDKLVDWQLKTINPSRWQGNLPILELREDALWINSIGARWTPETGWTRP